MIIKEKTMIEHAEKLDMKREHNISLEIKKQTLANYRNKEGVSASRHDNP
ncbi:MAG: hypothetical protein ABFD50_16075 [Smithella sp.]